MIRVAQRARGELLHIAEACAPRARPLPQRDRATPGVRRACWRSHCAASSAARSYTRSVDRGSTSSYASSSRAEGEARRAQLELVLDHFDAQRLDRDDGDRRALRPTRGGRAAGSRFLRAQLQRACSRPTPRVRTARRTQTRATRRGALDEAARRQFAARGAARRGAVRPRACDPVTFGNALDLLIHRGVIVRRGQPAARRERRFRKGPRFEELEPLRERLAAARATR